MTSNLFLWLSAPHYLKHNVAGYAGGKPSVSPELPVAVLNLTTVVLASPDDDFDQGGGMVRSPSSDIFRQLRLL